MLVITIRKYKDRESGKLYDVDDLRDVEVARGAELVKAGVAVNYTPKADKQPEGGDKNKSKEGDGGAETPETPAAPAAENGEAEKPKPKKGKK